MPRVTPPHPSHFQNNPSRGPPAHRPQPSRHISKDSRPGSKPGCGPASLGVAGNLEAVARRHRFSGSALRAAHPEASGPARGGDTQRRRAVPAPGPAQAHPGRRSSACLRRLCLRRAAALAAGFPGPSRAQALQPPVRARPWLLRSRCPECAPEVSSLARCKRGSLNFIPSGGRKGPLFSPKTLWFDAGPLRA